MTAAPSATASVFVSADTQQFLPAIAADIFRQQFLTKTAFSNFEIKDRTLSSRANNSTNFQA